MTTTIDWVATAERLPDDEECVLVAMADGEVWTGFIDADQWRYVSADPMSSAPLYWARFPPAPNA